MDLIAGLCNQGDKIGLIHTQNVKSGLIQFFPVGKCSAGIGSYAVNMNQFTCCQFLELHPQALCILKLSSQNEMIILSVADPGLAGG